MVTSKETLSRIKEIIDKHYKKLAISVLGKSVFSKKDLSDMAAQGLKVDNTTSFLELVYNHNFINKIGDDHMPTSVEDMEAQQKLPGIKPKGDAHSYAIESLNENTAQLIEKLKLDVQTKVSGIVKQNNDDFKHNALQNLTRPDEADELVKESSIGKVKQKLRDAQGDVSRNWERIAITETSNAVGAGSVDRIVSSNQDNNLKEVYVFRTIVADSKTCKWCRRFFQDSDGSPKLYRLSTLLGNGSNYGKKTAEWKAVVGAVHPRERCSQIMELPPGYKLIAGGNMTYIGLSDWNQYIVDKLTA